MGYLIALFIIIGVALIPVRIYARYNVYGAAVNLHLGPVRISLYPSKHKKAKKKSKSTDQFEEFESKQKNASTGGRVSDFLPLFATVLNFLNDLRRRIRINCLELKLILGGTDPCDLSVNYGRAWTVLGSLMPPLSRAFVIKKRNLEVECDYNATETTITAKVDISITVAKLLYLAARYGIQVLKQYLQIVNKRKGGAVT